MNKRAMLRVKAKSLAAEARIIRAEAAKARGRTKWLLNEHRKTVVRREARAACLALGFLRGRTLEQMEPTARTPAPMEKVKRLCQKYGPPGWNGPADWEG